MNAMQSRPAGLMATAAFVCAVTLGAQALLKLPDDGMKLPRGADSPGPVLFNHSMHVDDAAPDCTACHPKPFRILKSTAPTSPPITHERMGKGEACGVCHDGKKAFGLEEDCTFCHKDEE
jgi:c(7)-type cytochrome triheme protein